MSEKRQAPRGRKAEDELARLVQRLAEAEAELQAYVATSGQVDSIMDAGGQPILLAAAQSRLISSESEQRRSAETQAAILNAIPAHIALLDAAGVILVVNDSWRQFGTANGLQSTGSGVGSNYLEVCDHVAGTSGEEAAAVAQGLRQVLAGDQPEFALEYPCHSPTEPRWFRMIVTPVSPTRRAGAVVMHVDITERRLMESALRASEQQFASAFVHAPLGVALVSPEGRFLRINRVFYTMLGYTETEMLARTFQDITHPDDLRADLDRVAHLLAGTIASYRMVKRYRHRDGRVVWAELGVSLVRDEAGRPLHFISQVHDITEQIRATEALRDTNEKFEQLAANISDVFWVRSPDMQVIEYISPAYEQIWGRQVESANDSEQHWTQFILPEDRPRVQAAFADLMNRVPNIDLEYRIVRPDGTIRWVRVRGFQVRDSTGRLVRLTGIASDITERKEAEAQLRLLGTSVARLNDYVLIMEAEPLVEPGPRIVFANDAFIRRMGYPVEEVIGHSPRFLVGPKTSRSELERIEAAERAGQAVRSELVNYTKSGEAIWLELEIVPVTEESGRCTHFVAVGRDVTERKRAEAEILRSNRALQMLSQCNEVLIRAESEPELLQALCRTIVEVGGFRMVAVGYANEDPDKSISLQATTGTGGDYYRQTVPLSWAEDQPGGNGPAGRTVRTGAPVIIRDVQQDESFRPWLEAAKIHGFCGVIALPLKDRSRCFGVLILYLASVREVPADELHLLQELADDLAFGITTLRVRIERREAQLEIARQAALIDQAQDAFSVRTLDHRITFWSQGAERLYGHRATEVQNRLFQEITQPDSERFAEAMILLMRDGNWSGEIIKFTKEGKQRTVAARWTLIRDNQGQPESILSIDTDITEQKNLEQQFLRAQRMESIGTLAGGIAHDLNNLLAPITMGVELLRMQSVEPRSQKVIDNIERSARRGANLVKQVLSFARGVEGAKVALQVRHIVREAESIAENTFPKNIRIESRIAADLWLVLADPTQLNQVVVNLCVNARDAMPTGGTLELVAANETIDAQYAAMNPPAQVGRYVMISVSDTGCGMPPELIDRIFEPFFTTKELGHGTGLGLSTVTGIVRSHGGFIQVKSELGKGSTFTVYLPALPDGVATAADAEVRESLPRGNGELILVVDDEVSILEITKKTLEAFGYRVILAADGAEAIGLYAQKRDEIALVLTDMMMPVMDGPALIAALLRINPRVRIIGASGRGSSSALAGMGERRSRHFLPKPYSADVLLTKIREALREGTSRPPI